MTDFSTISTYTITLQGYLDDHQKPCFGDLNLASYTDAQNNPVHIATGEVQDQDTLHSLLNKIADLNLTILSINKLDYSPSMPTQQANQMPSYTHDHTRPVTIIGAVMIFSAFIAIGFGEAGAFSITALVWGSLLGCCALFFRHRSTNKLLDHNKSCVQMVQEQKLQHQREIIVRHILNNGMPEGTTPEHLQVILGEGIEQ